MNTYLMTRRIDSWHFSIIKGNGLTVDLILEQFFKIHLYRAPHLNAKMLFHSIIIKRRVLSCNQGKPFLYSPPHAKSYFAILGQLAEDFIDERAYYLRPYLFV